MARTVPHIEPKAQLQPVDLVAPGFRGLNLVQSGALLSPSFATSAQNTILDANGRLAARDGVTDITTTPISPAQTVRTLFEYYKGDGTTVTLVAWNGGISTSITNPQGSDISGAVVDANGTWWFQNFNDKVIGFQSGQKPIVYNGAGNFATVVESAGTAPSGGIGLAAFGRVWALDADGQTIKYSSLLDETAWSGGTAGLIDMRKIWTHGTDTVTAIRAFNGALVVFGKKHVVFWNDGLGSALGIDPANLVLVDVLAGTGCISQFSIQAVGTTDLLYASSEGVQSLQRVVQFKSNPVTTLTKYVRDDLLVDLNAETATLIRSTYNPLTGFYLLSLPTAGRTVVLDQRRRYVDEDGDELSIITMWTIAPTALLTTQIGKIIYLSIANGYVSRYAGDNDRGTTFRFIYQSPWLDLGEDFANRLKILKRLGSILFVRNQTTVIFKWSIDFRAEFNSVSKAISGDAAAEWGTGEWGLSEFSGGLALRILKVPARGRGQYYRIGIEADVNGEFAIQQAELFTKIGRLA